MHSHIWYWFMIFVLIWTFQILFLQNFYESMKTDDIIHLADTMLTVYEKEGYEDIFTELAVENDMCIEVRDRYGRVVYSKDMMGINCVIHGLNNQTLDIIRLVKADGDGIIYGNRQCVRFNYGCPRAQLVEAIDRMGKAILELRASK